MLKQQCHHVSSFPFLSFPFPSLPFPSCTLYRWSSKTSLSGTHPIITNYQRHQQLMEPYTYDEDEDEDEDDEQHEEVKYLIPKPSEWFPKLVSLQADLIYNSILTLCHPILCLFSIASESYHQAEEAKETVESAVRNAPSTIIHGAVLLLKKLGCGFFGAAYVCVLLIMLLILAAVVGIALVWLWLEEPVVVRERLHFDYTQAHPKAVFVFGGAAGSLQGLAAASGAGYFNAITGNKHIIMGVPVGHTFTVSLELLMPESDFNSAIGVFQLTAELLSTNGDVIAKSSQPCMLRFRSLPIRLTRTFIMGAPVLLGISGETQKLTVQILRHKEGTYPRTRAIRITLSPRAGSSHLPQLYEAEIVLNSQLPWTKQLVHSWRWTLYVWTSFYCYLMFLIILVTCCRPLLLPVRMITAAASYVANHDSSTTRDRWASTQVPRRRPLGEATTRLMDDYDRGEDISDLLRKWHRSRSKRKAIFLQTDLPSETIGTSSAPSTITTREDASTVAAEEDVGDSESVCT